MTINNRIIIKTLINAFLYAELYNKSGYTIKVDNKQFEKLSRTSINRIRATLYEHLKIFRKSTLILYTD